MYYLSAFGQIICFDVVHQKTAKAFLGPCQNIYDGTFRENSLRFLAFKYVDRKF